MKLSNAFRFKDHIPHDLDLWPKSTQVVVALVVAKSSSFCYRETDTHLEVKLGQAFHHWL